MGGWGGVGPRGGGSVVNHTIWERGLHIPVATCKRNLDRSPASANRSEGSDRKKRPKTCSSDPPINAHRGRDDASSSDQPIKTYPVHCDGRSSDPPVNTRP